MFNFSNSTNDTSDSRQKISPTEYVIFAGLLVCILGLAILIATYLLTSRRNTVSGRLFVNLCTALSLLYFSSVSNSVVTPNSHMYCKVKAILGHWILLALFHALAAQALWIYLKLGRPFAQEPCYYSVKAIVASWVSPLLITVVCVASGYHNYRKHSVLNRCTATGYTFIFGIALPSFILMVFTSLMLSLAVISICRAKQKSKLHTNPQGAALQARQMRKTCFFFGLLIMVALGWLAGIFAVLATGLHVSSLFVTATVIYFVCGYGQGVYLFLFVGVFNRSVRQDWKTLLCFVMGACKLNCCNSEDG